MTIQELHTDIMTAKKFLNREVVKLKTTAESSYRFRELTDKLDLIHEVERIGMRNLSEREQRKITKMLTILKDTDIWNN